MPIGFGCVRCVGRVVLWALVLLVIAPGCLGPMARIDRKTDRLIAKRSAGLGAEAVPPRPRAYKREPIRDRARELDESPGTAFPEVESMRFDPADESRDVEQRLSDWSALGGGSEAPESIMSIDLPTALKIAQRTSRDFVTAEEDYIVSALRLLVERHRWGPRLFNDTTVTASGAGNDGRFESAVRVLNELRVTQRLPYGGEVSARWLFDATEQLRKQVSGRYRQASRLVLAGNIPLLRGGGAVARESKIQAERDLVYAARTFERFRQQQLVNVANDYFRLVQTQAQISNLERQRASFKNLLRGTQLKVKAGRERLFSVNNVRNQLLSAESSLASQREQFILQLDRFKIRLGIPVTQAVHIEPLELYLPEPEVTPEQATRFALDYRLDLQTRRDQIDDAGRSIANARNNLLPDLNLTGSVTIPTDPDRSEGRFSIEPEDLNYSAGITFGLPLDREIERLQLRQAQIGFQRRLRDYEEFRDRIVLDARAAVRTIDLARFRLRLAEERVSITRLREREQSLRSDVVPQSRIDTQTDLLSAENNRDQALTDLRSAILNYLLTTGLMRVGRDGQFLPLPGMPPPAKTKPDDTRPEPADAQPEPADAPSEP